MTLTAVLLVLFSAIIHTGWNLVTKREKTTTSLFFAANVLGGLVLLPALFVWSPIIPKIPPPVWVLIVLTGVVQALYYASLSAAYRAGDMSLVYPLARSSPILIVMLVTALRGTGNPLSPMAILGALLVTSGILLIPLTRFRDFHPSSYRDRATLLALVAAVGTAGYQLIDDESMRQLRLVFDGAMINNLQISLVYLCLEILSTSVFLLPVLFKPGEIGEILHHRLKLVFIIGIGMPLAYGLVLVAMGFVTNFSYLFTFRQFSIPLGAALGMLLLREPAYKTKILGILVIFCGLILVGFG